MRLPRPVLLPLCCGLTAAAYYLVLFTGQGSYGRGRGPWGVLAFHSVVVLAAFACWEVFRTERLTQVRALAAAVGAPLAILVLATLLDGLRRHVPF